MNAKKEVVLWTGAGFSHGSQQAEQNRPPLGVDFFQYGQVKKQLNAYPVLSKVWELYGRPENLERFWSGLDTDFSQRKRFNPDKQPELENCLTQAAENPPDPCLKDYYQLYKDASEANLSSRVGAVAGFDLKALLIDLLREGPSEKELLLSQWRAIRQPFRIITFNYDLFVETTLPGCDLSFAYEPTLQEGRVDYLKLHGSLQWVQRKYCDRDGPSKFQWRNIDDQLEKNSSLTINSPSGFFGQRCDHAPCFHLIDPLIIGLREKREFSQNEGDPLVRRFFGSLLSDAQQILREAREVIVVGFAFEKADGYLWNNLSQTQIGGSKRFLCCYKGRDGKDDEYERKVQEFFGNEGNFFHSGFTREFLDPLRDFLAKD